MDKKLGLYRQKRSHTNEPFGEETPTSAVPPSEYGAFVVHLHDATRRHFDVRLEAGGVLWSFAVPKGPSLDPKEKVLAVKTEDHPIEYLEFEDVIPAGQYGAGPMIVWDRGWVRYLEGPPEEELAQGKLHVELAGMKLRGRWAFVKLAKGETGAEWLLFKKQDETAAPARKITEELPRSVLSGLTVDELEQRDRISGALVDRALSLGAGRSDAVRDLQTRAPATSPLVVATAGGRTQRDSIFDPQLDGVRVLALRDGDSVTLRTWTAGHVETIEDYYPEVVRALRAIAVTSLAVDGELVAFDGSGRPSTALLAQRVARIGKGEAHRAVTLTPVFLVVHDLLALGDADTRTLPVEARRELVTSLLPSVGVLRAATLLDGEESAILSSCAALGLSTVVAKPRGSTYDARADWRELATGIPPASRSIVQHTGHGVHAGPARVVVTNRDKVFWPDEPSAPGGHYTKGDLVDYYDRVADVLLPYLKDRPTILVRYPDGIHGKSFFQWNVPVGMPSWVRTMTMHEVEDFVATPDTPPPSSHRSRSRRPSVVPPSSRAPSSQKTPKRVFLVDDRATLLYIANLGCIPLHVLASRAPDLTRSDFLTLDFDVKQSELRHAITLTRTLRALLDEIGLPGFPKTSGQTGLHVLVPLGPNQSFDTARALADLLGRLLVDRHPKLATMERIVARRGDRVYVDTGQTGTSRAIVAPYSVRAVAGATVSAPLAWDEVTPSLDPRIFTMRSVPPRVAKEGDLLAGLLRAEPDVPGAVAKLAERIGKPPL
jgi:bifunctional non-homologous end joining protein LigD